MGCGNNTSLLEEELGILPRAIRQLYESIEERQNQAEFLVSIPFISNAQLLGGLKFQRDMGLKICLPVCGKVRTCTFSWWRCNLRY